LGDPPPARSTLEIGQYVEIINKQYAGAGRET
jgi:hypothetical protein